MRSFCHFREQDSSLSLQAGNWRMTDSGLISVKWSRDNWERQIKNLKLLLEVKKNCQNLVEIMDEAQNRWSWSALRKICALQEKKLNIGSCGVVAIAYRTWSSGITRSAKKLRLIPQKFWSFKGNGLSRRKAWRADTEKKADKEGWRQRKGMTETQENYGFLY